MCTVFYDKKSAPTARRFLLQHKKFRFWAPSIDKASRHCFAFEDEPINYVTPNGKQLPLVFFELSDVKDLSWTCQECKRGWSKFMTVPNCVAIKMNTTKTEWRTVLLKSTAHPEDFSEPDLSPEKNVSSYVAKVHCTVSTAIPFLWQFRVLTSCKTKKHLLQQICALHAENDGACW